MVHTILNVADDTLYALVHIAAFIGTLFVLFHSFTPLFWYFAFVGKHIIAKTVYAYTANKKIQREE